MVTMESAPEAPITPGEDPGAPAEGDDQTDTGGGDAPGVGGDDAPGEGGDEAPTG